jgi:hypothetical protein
LPVESVTTVDLPSEALLDAKLPPLLEWVTVPPGPVVVPVTLPSPAVTEVDIELLAPGGDSPFFNSTTLQLSEEEEDVLPPAPVLADELLELLVWACAAAKPTDATARTAMRAFTSDLLFGIGADERTGCAARRPRSQRRKT